MTENYQCIGCGARIQTEQADAAGYLPNSALQKGLEKGEFYCQRCFKLRHYNELQDIAMSEDVFLDKLSQIALDDAFVIYVVDLFDIEGSLITGLPRFIGNQPFVVAANKYDLLPKVTNFDKVKDWVRQSMNRYDLFPEAIILTSATKNSGINDLITTIEKEIKRRNIYIVGVTNVGKSTLINQLIAHYGGEREIITTSNHPGTTLDLIKIPLTEQHAVIDTPGIIKHSQLGHILSREDLKLVYPSKPFKPKTYQLREGQTVFMAGLARVDLLRSESDHTALTFYVANDLYLHRTKLEQAEQLYANHLGDLLSPPSASSLENFPALVAKEYRLKPDQDLSISGLGWLTTNATCDLQVWLPKGIGISHRRSII